MKFVAISDTHNRTDGLQLPDADVLIVAGDVSSRGRPDELRHFLDFIARVRSQFSHVIVTAGNHEFSLDESIDRYYLEECVRMMREDTNITYLEDSSCVINNPETGEPIKIFGSPWTLEYWGGFQIHSDKADTFWAEVIPNDADIVITHGPPYGIGDVVRGQNVGDKGLLQAIMNVKPKVHIFGHIHEGHGHCESNETLYINAAICDEVYRPINKPIVFTYPNLNVV